jgi:serine/threonine protein phosphatase 1
MRILVIGDIHGCLTAFNTLLDAVEVQPEDLLITLGDYVDRGPDSRGVLDRLIALHATGRLIALRGNHDQMMMEARKGQDMLWLACGGQETLDSYGIAVPNPSALTEVPDSHWAFLEDDCRDWYETERHIYVHANAYAELPLEEQPISMLYWEKLIDPCVHESGKIMVCGHTRQKNGLPLNLGATICIDTGAYDADGWLTCLDVNRGKYWQANQKGEVRTGWLEGPSDDRGP